MQSWGNYCWSLGGHLFILRPEKGHPLWLLLQHRPAQERWVWKHGRSPAWSGDPSPDSDRSLDHPLVLAMENDHNQQKIMMNFSCGLAKIDQVHLSSWMLFFFFWNTNIQHLVEDEASASYNIALPWPKRSQPKGTWFCTLEFTMTGESMWNIGFIFGRPLWHKDYCSVRDLSLENQW